MPAKRFLGKELGFLQLTKYLFCVRLSERYFLGCGNGFYQ